MRIKIHDNIIRTLIDIHRMLDLKKNILSSSTFDFQVYKYTSKSGSFENWLGCSDFHQEKIG